MIIEHGHWSVTTSPEQQRVLHAHRDDTGMDWNEFVALKPFNAGSIIMTVGSPGSEITEVIVQAATRDPTAIFPAGMLVIEETEYAGNNPFNDFHGRLYADGKIGDMWVPPPPPLTAKEIQQRLAALEAKAGL